MASSCFEITLSMTLSPEQIAQAFTDLVPSGARVDVQSEFPDEPGAVWVQILKSEDPHWPCVLAVSCLDDSGLSPYGDLQIANRLWERFGADSICSTHLFVEEGLDPRDPYWALACIEGQWHMADTCGTRLTGTGSGKVTLLRPVNIPQ